MSRSDLSLAELQQALSAIGDIREQHLIALIERDDFPPFVTGELKKELASLREAEEKYMGDHQKEELLVQIYEASSYLLGAEGDAHKLADRIARGTGGREVSLAITKLQEAGMWLKQAAAEIDAVGKPTTGEEGA